MTLLCLASKQIWPLVPVVGRGAGLRPVDACHLRDGQLAFFLAFGIGFGLPLFAIGLLDQLSGARLARGLVRWERLLQVVLGVALLVIGAWDLWSNLPNLIG